MRYANDMPTLVQTHLSAELRIAVMRLARRLRAQRAETDLTLSQLSALSAVERHGPPTPGGLAAPRKGQPPSLTRMVGRLAGLARPPVDPQCRRARHHHRPAVPADAALWDVRRRPGRSLSQAATAVGDADHERGVCRCARRARRHWRRTGLARLCPCVPPRVVRGCRYTNAAGVRRRARRPIRSAE